MKLAIVLKIYFVRGARFELAVTGTRNQRVTNYTNPCFSLLEYALFT